MLLLKFFILFLGHNVMATTAEINPCSYYLDKEKETGCWFHEKNSSDYLVKYGYKYCSTFNNKAKKWQDLRTQWVQETSLCLQKNLENSSSLNCVQLENKAFDSHPHCYASTGFCSLSLIQKTSIIWTIIGIDVLLKPNRSFYQGFRVLKNCLNELPPEIDELYKLAMKTSSHSESYEKAILHVLDADGLNDAELNNYLFKVTDTLKSLNLKNAVDSSAKDLDDLISYKMKILKK